MADIQKWLEELTHEDPAIRITAITQLTEAQHQPAVVEIGLILRDDIDVGVRYQAAKSLAEFATQDALPYLIHALRGNDLWIRVAATQGLIRIGTEATEGLVDVLTNSHKAARRAAAKALGKINDGAATDALRRALLDSDIDVRRFSVQALGRIGDVSTLDAISDALRDDAVEVRRAAAHALINLGDASLPILHEALQDSQPEVNILAIMALRELGHEPPPVD